MNPGQHFVTMYGSKSASDRVSFDAAVGREVYVKAEPSIGGPVLSLIDVQTGKAEISSCHQSQP